MICHVVDAAIAVADVNVTAVALNAVVVLDAAINAVEAVANHNIINSYVINY